MDATSRRGDGGLGAPRILDDLADGRLTDDEADAVVAWIAAEGLDDVPPWVLNRAVRIAGQAVATDAPRPTLWRRLVATLVCDTRLQVRTAGARSVDLDRPRLLYAAGGVEIDLQVGDSVLAGRVRVLGQVAAAAPDLAGAWVAVDGPSGHLEATVDDLGQFALDGLTTGAHRMQVGLIYEMIEIPDLRV
jgi:hypothetical protein